MYRDSSEWLCVMDYYNGVEDFINYALSNSRNISGCGIRCPCNRCKNKTFLDPDILTMHLLQNSSWRNTCVGLHIKNHMFFMRPC